MFFLCIFFYLSIYKSYLLSTIVNWGLIIFALLSVIAFIFISISDGFRKTLVKTIPIVRGFLFFITFVKAILYFGGSLLLLLFSLLIYNVFVVNVDENASDSSKAWKGSKGLTYLFLASASNFLGILAPLLILTFFLGSDLPRLTSIIPDQTLLRPNSLAASFILPSFGLFLGIIGSLNSGEFALTKHRNIRVILGQSDKFPFNYRSFLKNASDCSLILYLREKCRFNLHEIQLYLTRCEINHLKNEIILLDQAKIQSSTPLKLERLHSLLKYWRFDLSILEWLNTTDWSHEDPALQATVISYIAKCTIEVNLRRSQIYLELKNYQASLECLNQLIKFQPKRPNFFALRSKVYAESHQYERAIMDIDKAIELAPNSYEYLMTKGQYFEKSGDRFSGTNYTFDALKHHKTKNKVNLIKAYIRSRKEDYFTALFLTQRIQSEQDTLIKETMIRELVNHWKNQPLTLSFLKAQAQKEQIPSTKKLITTLIRKIGENSH